MAVYLPKHVDVIGETIQDAGSIPAASTLKTMGVKWVRLVA